LSLDTLISVFGHDVKRKYYVTSKRNENFTGSAMKYLIRVEQPEKKKSHGIIRNIIPDVTKGNIGMETPTPSYTNCVIISAH